MTISSNCLILSEFKHSKFWTSLALPRAGCDSGVRVTIIALIIAGCDSALAVVGVTHFGSAKAGIRVVAIDSDSSKN
jgi:hypothetical protein